MNVAPVFTTAIRKSRGRIVLLTGFGGLLLLMTFAGLDAIRALGEIQSSNNRIREDFLLRTRLLERIRADLYVSGTYVRDHLLEQDEGRAAGHRYSLIETRQDMDAAVAEYGKLLGSQDTGPFWVLKRELAAYWQVLDPVFAWSPERRQSSGYAFLRDEVFPRRTSMLGIADRIAALNELQLNTGRREVEAAFRELRVRLWAAAAVTLVLGAVLAVLTTRRILTLEAETAAHYSAVAKAQAEMQQLSARLVEAQEDERRKISRELHDEVGQALMGTLVEMANLSSLRRAGNAEAAAAKAEEIKKQLEGAVHVVRDMSLLLRPSMLDDLGLVPALQWQAREVSKRSGIRVKLSADDVPEDLPEEYRTCVYRLVQEALHNVVQHAEAHNARVAVRREDGRLLLSVEDDGHGFDASQGRGMGLLGMQERVKRLDGSLQVDSAPDRGTTLHVVLPLPASQRLEEIA